MLTFLQLEGFLDAKRNELLKAVGQFTEDELHLTEYEGGWNVPQIVEHLVSVESFIVKQVEDMLRSHPEEPSEPIENKEVDVVALFKEKGVIGKKTVAPAETLPIRNIPLPEGLKQLNAIRAKLKSYLPHLERRATNSIQAHFDVIGLHMNVCQWIHFASIHELVHIKQINRIRKANHPVE